MSDQSVVVIGAGVSGLTTALRLQEAGWRVRIVTAVPPEQTTSSVAAALWYPYKAYPQERVLGWSRRSYAVFVDLAHDTASGVDLREGMELFRHVVPDPWWRDAVPALRRPTPEELPPGYCDGYLFRVPVIDMSVYLAYLQRRFVAGGGVWEQRRLRSLDDALALNHLVINCAGLGARELAGDALLQPIRGQIVRVRNPGLDRFVLDDEHPEGITYIIPRRSDCVLGGTAEEDRWDTTPDPATAAAILRRCIAIEPRLSEAEILEHKVGLRPGRPAVRLEREERPDGLVIHNYGHGGAGVTLAWGCAEDVVRLVSDAYGAQHTQRPQAV
ncbi:FAD-dependent oxidoreductase [Kallotenue papyrolyticum]|uniref:FAD-dependent oxidoreductase n=1 Tax=Kallotenue papyrolyticum TaxID=1325125 RepID=UPI000470319A|nr:FAD-dependent oxidoreductase [Kallotenue papyrolyticum]